MVGTLITALLPVVVTLCIGYYAGMRKTFDGEYASGINKLVMNFTLPLSLFGGILATSRSTLFANARVALWIFIGMVGGYILVFLVTRFLMRQSTPEAALQTLAITGPAIPFIGPTVLGALFPNESAILISIGGLVMNIIQVPATIILLSSEGKDHASLGQMIVSAVKKPVVWAPILAFILCMVGLHITPAWERSFTTLGAATSGLALFSSGLVLYEKKLTLSGMVWFNTLGKLVVIPGIMFAIMMAFHVDATTLNESVVALGMPTAAITAIFANQYHIREREMASTLGLTTVLSVLTLGVIILVRGI
ncbi:receptor protein [Bombiscardovia nodaiensis]|uniref:Receptor protein n=1 Tax=Bombiscardovia nodaiensis TaxID=2932181 RepID=A0ABM8B7X6_9BIFI|nr:receptor protein [Bombiscardovia nodaiensis]